MPGLAAILRLRRTILTGVSSRMTLSRKASALRTVMPWIALQMLIEFFQDVRSSLPKARAAFSSGNFIEYGMVSISSLERQVLRATRRTDTDTTVLDAFSRQDELAEVVADHLRLDLEVHEVL